MLKIFNKLLLKNIKDYGLQSKSGIWSSAQVLFFLEQEGGAVVINRLSFLKKTQKIIVSALIIALLPMILTWGLLGLASLIITGVVSIGILILFTNYLQNLKQEQRIAIGIAASGGFEQMPASILVNLDHTNLEKLIKIFTETNLQEKIFTNNYYKNSDYKKLTVNDYKNIASLTYSGDTSNMHDIILIYNKLVSS
jgi:hypothetical protein